MADNKPKLACAPNPCDSCPYRKDCPPGVWAREEYDKLPQWDEQWGGAGIFLCHNTAGQERQAVCRGWLEVHERNIGVRMAMLRSIDMPEDCAPTKVPLHESGAAARRAGLRGLKRPPTEAREMIQKLVKRRPDRAATP